MITLAAMAEPARPPPLLRRQPTVPRALVSGHAAMPALASFHAASSQLADSEARAGGAAMSRGGYETP